MIKIAHESPKSIFNEVQKYTDYDYALVHLFEEDQEYFNQFKEAIKNGREVILDNSIFELEEAFDADKFIHWVNELRAEWYIVPDALEDTKKTMSQMADWNLRYADVAYGKKIGVVQGKTYEQIKSCYEYMDKFADVDMIAISFDYSYYTETISDKPHHLLGCGLPQEFSFYSDYNWIYSLDTSNPVVHGRKGIGYNSDGLWNKESQKLHELMNYQVEDTNLILNNIHKFRWFANGKKEV